MRPLHRTAQAAFSGLDEPASCGVGRPGPELLDAGRLRSLYDCLREIPEYRSARGIRHGVASVQAIAVAGKLAGHRDHRVRRARLTQRQLAAAHAFRSPTTARLTPPVEIQHSHHFLRELDPGALDRAVRRWTTTRRGPAETLVLDGKSVPLNTSLWRRPGPLPDRRHLHRPHAHDLPASAPGGHRQYAARQRDALREVLDATA